MADVGTGDRRSPHATMVLVVALVIILVLGIGAIAMGGKDEETNVPADGVRVFRLSELVDHCPGAKPMLARALADDRIDIKEANAIEDEGRRLWRISTDATFHNAARQSAGLAKNPEPAKCSLPYGVAN